MESINFLITGVGGQGTVLASDIMAAVGVAAGYDVKKSDILGLSVRGGGVVGHVRWGEKVYSPIVPEGRADFLIAFEMLECLRWLDQIKPNGKVLVNEQKILPVIVSSGLAKYPTDERSLEIISSVTPNYYRVPAIGMAMDLGTSRVLNVILLGALSQLLEVPAEVWEEVLCDRVPKKHLETNLKAFQTGRTWIKEKAL